MFGRKAWSPPEKPTAPADSGVRWLPRQRADIEFAPTTPIRKPSSSAGAARNARRQEQRQMRSCAPVIRRTVCAAPGYFDHRGTAQGRRGFQHLSDRFARLSYLPDLAPAVQSPAPGAFSLGPAAARSLFGAVKKRMGGGSPRGPTATPARRCTDKCLCSTQAPNPQWPSKTRMPCKALCAVFWSISPSFAHVVIVMEWSKNSNSATAGFLWAAPLSMNSTIR